MSEATPGKSPAGQAIAERALEFVRDGDVVGLGSGRAATAFVKALGERVKGGLRVQGVPTSQATADLATSLGIPLLELADAPSIAVTVDGADEVDPSLDLIKGYGGALVREKVVAAASQRLVILVGPEKIVPALGSRGKLPVEVVPFALALCRRLLTELHCGPVLRESGKGPYVTDNGFYILDCEVGEIGDPAGLDREILSIPGVLGTGLFVGMAEAVLVERDESVEVRTRSSS